MKFAYPRCLGALMLAALFQGQVSASADGLTIEQVQRDFQVRYHTVNQNAYVDWPSCSSSMQTPAPRFPKDGFYGDTSLDPDRGVELVQDLVQKFYSSATIYNAFVKAPNGESD